jgi:D-alanyl-D-alanine carboxypeptidase/D-alanyl-D-alanine-endopeptidase (penicillin-binding protein 4)
LYQKGVKEKRRLLFALNTTYKFERWGSGWSWNDYGESYMAERSIFPIYGNLVKVSLKDTLHKFISDSRFPPIKKFHPFITYPKYFDSLVNHQEVFFPEDEFKKLYPKAKISRAMESNTFLIEPADIVFRNTEIPFVTDIFTVLDILSDTLNKPVGLITPTEETGKFFYASEDYEKAHVHINKWNVLHSQPTDSLLKPMMHRSDNFFAEQSLLMVSNELLGVMNDAKIIDTLLKTDFKNLPQKPKWVDGSGLSRYNLFTPQDFVFILNKMKTDFGMDRIKTILPTGNEGTLEGRFVRDSNYIFAKTGTLSGVVSLSGFLYTKKNKLLIFSFLVNNHNSSAGEIRRAVEKFIQGIRNQY